MRKTTISRRGFVAGVMASTIGFPAILRARGVNDKLNIVVIACGGRGAANMAAVKSENIVALCDVNENALEAAGKIAPEAKKFKDYRKLYDKLKDHEYDAVMVSTPEHHHAFATLPALRRKKHVYCEKPLTRDVYEARMVTEAAKKAKVATQMGTQMHSTNNFRRVVELIDAEAIGPVSEVHVWVDRAWGLQSEEAAIRNKDPLYVKDGIWLMDRPKEEMPVPAHLDWDLWIGPAPYRPYHSCYVPGSKWYRWWDFGNGTMSDLGSHWNDLPWWALRLDAPKTVEAFGGPAHPEIAPATMRAVYEYGPRGTRPAVKLTWYQGEMKPVQWEEKLIPQWKNGVLFVGTKGRMLLSDYKNHVLLPEEEFKEYERPAKSIPEVASESHQMEWVMACKTGSPTGSPFATYAGPLTEANHLGNVAYRAGKKIEWDAKRMRIANYREAERFLRRKYRKGWGL